MSLKKHNNTVSFSITPTITLSAYTQYDVVGGAMIIALNGGGTLRRVKVQDDDDQKEPYKLYFFRADPDIADADAFAPTDAELDDLIDSLSILATDYDEWGGANTVAIKNDMGIEFDDDTTSIYVYAVAQETPDMAATDGLTFEFAFWTNKG